MKSSFVAFAFVLTALVSFGDGQVVIWDNYGTGGWQSDSQWVGGKKPVAGDTVRLIGVSVSVTQTDWDFVSALAKIQPGENATLIFDLDEDVESGLQIQFLDESSRFTKTNTKVVRLTNTDYGLYGRGTIEVLDGTLKLDDFSSNALKNFAYPLLVVRAPGVLDLPASSHVYCRGLVGDGTVMRSEVSSEQQLIFMGDGTPYDFSGHLATNISLTAGQESKTYVDYPADQTFSGVTNGYVKGLRLYNGLFGVADFGDSKNPSSLGFGTADMGFTGNAGGADVGWRYVGPGNVTVQPGRNFRFDFKATTCEAVFDAGAIGGLRFENEWKNRSRDSFNGKVASIVLTGSNAVPCVIAGNVHDENSATYPNRNMRFTKRGTGTWRFGDSAKHTFRGPVFVEQGRLEYETIAETNEICSLGYGTVFSTNTTEVAADIPYIHRIGDGRVDTAADDLATFAYAGTENVACETRPVALWGAGRFTGGDVRRFGWNGFMATPDGGTLVLDGDNVTNYNYVTGLKNGEGVLSVEKQGTGTWYLQGTNTFTGSLAVKEGTLVVEGDNPHYGWFRFTVLDMVESGFPKIQEIALYDDTGVRRNVGLAVERKFIEKDKNLKYETVGDPEDLQPGMAAYGRTGTYEVGASNETDDRDLLGCFDDSADSPRANGWVPVRVPPYSSFKPDGTEARAIPIVMRLADGAPRIAAFDICTGPSIQPVSVMKSWRFEGSLDGLSWDVLTNVEITVDTTDMTEDNRRQYSNKWYSHREQKWWGDALASGRRLTAEDPGFPLRGFAKKTGLNALKGVKWVSVAPGAKLIANGEATIPGLSVNPVVGTGTIEGFSFAEEGVVNVENVTGREAAFDVDIKDCTGFDNVGNWQVAVDGKVRSSWTATATADGHVTVKAGGLMLIVK